MMNRFLLVAVVIVAMLSMTSAFSPAKTAFVTGSRVSVSTVVRPNTSQLNMIFGGPKDDGKPGDYVCLVSFCGGVSSHVSPFPL